MGLTMKQIQAFPVPQEDARAYLWDPDLVGFGVAFYGDRVRSYVVQYRSRGENKSRRQTIGRVEVIALDEARRRAKAILGEVADGADPLGERRAEAEKAREHAAAAHTLHEYYEKNFLPYSLPRWRKTTAREMQRLWKSRIEESLGAMRIEEIAPAHVERWMNDMAEVPGAANVAVRLLKSVLNHAVRMEAIERNPARLAKQFKRPKMERFLSPRETAALLDAITEEERIGLDGKKAITRTGSALKGVRGGKGLHEEGSRGITRSAAGILRLLLLTGARRDEIRLARWSWVDWENPSIKLPEEGSKTGSRRVPLSAEALDVILPAWTAAGKPRDGFIFPGAKPDAPMREVRKSFLRVCARAGIENLRIHDLRHSAASIMIANGASLRVVGGVLGHKTARTTERYAHLADSTIAAAAELLGRAVREAQETGGGARIVDVEAKPEAVTPGAKKAARR